MNKKNKTLAKNTIILGIGQFIPKIIAMITLPILTKAFSTEEYGIYDLIISFSSLSLPLLTLMIQLATFRFIIEDNDEIKRKSYVTNSTVFVIALSLTWLLIVSVVSLFIDVDLSFVAIVFLVYFAEAIYNLFGQIARGYGKNTIYSLAVVMYSVVNMIFLVLVMLFDFVNIKSALIIIAISYTIASIFLWISVKIKNDFSIKTLSVKVMKRMLGYAIPIIPSTISLWIVNLSDRLVITYFLGASYNGLYAAASKIPNLFGTVYNVFNLAWTELAARSIKEDDIDKYYSKLFNNLYSFLIGAMLALITLTPIMFNILIDDKFYGGYNQILILFIGILCSSLVSFYGGLYVALKKTKQVGISSIVGAVLNFVINVLFIRYIGLYAASISTLVSFLVILIYRFFEVKKFINIKYNYTRIVIGIIFLIISVVNFYQHNIFGFILNIFITLIFNIFGNEFLRAFFKMSCGKMLNKKTQ